MQKSQASSSLIMHSTTQNNPPRKFKQLSPLIQHEKVILQFIYLFIYFSYSHNLVNVCVKCDYMHLNHNSLVSKKKIKKKIEHQRHDYKGGLLYQNPNPYNLIMIKINLIPFTKSNLTKVQSPKTPLQLVCNQN